MYKGRLRTNLKGHAAHVSEQVWSCSEKPCGVELASKAHKDERNPIDCSTIPPVQTTWYCTRCPLGYEDENL